MNVINKRVFEAVLIFAALAETSHLIGLFDRRTEMDGLALAIAFTVVSPALTLALGFSITRLRSVSAKWGFLFLMSLVWMTMIKLGASTWWGDLWLTLGFLAGTAQTLAALMLLTPKGWAWTRKPRRVAVTTEVA